MKRKNIPNRYMWHNGIRKCSPIENEIHRHKLDEIECPNCGCKYLRNGEYGDSNGQVTYKVICDNCDWEMPIKPISDCGDAIVEFKDWLSAYKLLGEPKDRLNENLILEFWPVENGEREIARLNYEEG